MTRLLMRLLRAGLLAGSIGLLATPASATVMVLLHGHLGVGAEWRNSGFTDALIQAGWQDGGHLRELDGRVNNRRRDTAPGPQVFFTLDLAGESALQTQAEQLGRYLDAIRVHYPRETYTLVGFSAGGVVARLYLVQHPAFPAEALISIASPHLGTESAELALLAGETPLADYATLFGADFINESRALYRDLVRERNGNFLYTLNRQPHPDIAYLSIVRVNTTAEVGDLVVPADSQDMDNVTALRGRVRTLKLPGVHGIIDSDAEAILAFLSEPRPL